MKSALLAMGCLLAGALAALGYSHYLGEGKNLSELQLELSDKATALATAQKESQTAKSETEAMSTQIQQLTATKQDLTHQVEQLKSAAAPPAATAPAPAIMGFSGSSMASIVKAQMASRNEEKFQRLVKRLNLTDDQQATLRAAMDAEDKRTEEMTAKMLAGGKVDPAAVAAEMKGTKSVEQTLNDMLTPDQKTTYTQMKTDEKANNAEAMASMEMNQMATSLNLSDAQKDQVGSALYQNQLNMQDPAWIKANMPSTPGDPLAMIDAQAKAKEDALAKVLTPDQLATYHQQAQSQLAMQKTIMQKFMPAATTAPAAPAATPAPAPANP
jgi:hypothetical protein